MALTIPRHLTPPYLLTPVAVTILGLALILHVHLATAQTTPLPWLVCNTTVNYTEKSAYQANLHRLATTLPSNASSSPALFAVDAAGTVVPDTVYALALCRGDTNDTSACSSCVTNAFRNARRLCALNKGATLYADACILRYADWDFLTNTTSDDDNSQPYVASRHRNVSAAKAAAFDAASARLINATAELAAADPVKRFGTGEESFDETYYPVIYSLAQCMPDMSAADCRACLGDMIRAVTPKYFAGKEGGRAFGVRCNFRFQTFPFFHGNPMLQILQAPPMPLANMNPLGTSEGRALAIAVPTVVLTLALACFCFSSMRIERRKGSIMPYSINPDDIQSIDDSLLLDLSTLRKATNNFAESNKLGEGGFGAVYKGLLFGSQEIAVKRLSLGSRQGIEELKTELVLVAKLQHNNLVRLVGFCLEEDEKLLVYEYMPNTSLDTILFDSQKSNELDWEKRLRIVNGVARGLQYLHEESRLKIVHRDLKPSNVLLDFDYHPKISDFGLAKLIDRDQSQGVTHHIAGTYGYMSPEYAVHGQYSVKSDVFSLGVLVLEILTGKKNSSGFANPEESVGLLRLVWEHWTAGTTEELMDPFLDRRPPHDQMLKLVCIGLLCTQDNPANRPTMSSVNVMLSSNTMSLDAPSRPTFYDAYSRAFQSASNLEVATSRNEASLTVTELEAR